MGVAKLNLNEKIYDLHIIQFRGSSAFCDLAEIARDCYFTPSEIAAKLRRDFFGSDIIGFVMRGSSGKNGERRKKQLIFRQDKNSNIYAKGVKSKKVVLSNWKLIGDKADNRYDLWLCLSDNSARVRKIYQHEDIEL